MDSNRTAQQLRRDRETPEARQARVDANRAAQQLRRDRETSAARQARLQQNATSTRTSRVSGKLKGIDHIVFIVVL